MTIRTVGVVRVGLPLSAALRTGIARRNPDLVGTEIETVIRALALGQRYDGGGGSMPAWSIRRVS